MLLVTQTWGVGMGEAGPTLSPDQVSVARVCRYRCPEPTGLVLLVLFLARGGGVGQGMVLSITVGTSVGQAQTDRWTDAWTDRSAAETYWEKRKPLSDLHPVLAQGESTGNSVPLYLLSSIHPNRLMNPSTDLRAQVWDRRARGSSLRGLWHSSLSRLLALAVHGGSLTPTFLSFPVPPKLPCLHL